MITAPIIRQIVYKSLLVVTALILLLAVSYGAARAKEPGVTASYLYDLTGMGTDARFDHPRDVFIDGEHGEIYVADSFNHRVKIFNSSGMMLFQFGSEKTMRMPLELVVDSRGVIYVLHGFKGGLSISAYNYRGVFQRTISYENLPLDVPVVSPSGMAVDKADNLYVVDDQETVKRVLVYSPEGEFLRSFRIMADLDEKLTRESFCGKASIAEDGTFYIPNPMVGTVYAYTPEGEFLRTVGRKGGAPGKFTFPSDVAADSYGNVLVLDTMRHTILVFTKEGKFVSEFGGFGLVDGWFYNPNSIALDPEDRVYIAQVVNNRVQVLKLHRPGPKATPVSLTTVSQKGGD